MHGSLLPAQQRPHDAEGRPERQCRPILQIQPAAPPQQRHESRPVHRRESSAAATALLTGRVLESGAIENGPHPGCKAVPDPYIPSHRRSIVRDKPHQVLQKQVNLDRRRRRRKAPPAAQTPPLIEPPRSISRFLAVPKTTHAGSLSDVPLLNSD